MISNEGKNFLRGIGILAESVICEAESYDGKEDKESVIENMAELTVRIKNETKLLSIGDLRILLDKYGIAFAEYADMLYDAVRKIPYDNNEVKFKADAVVSIVLDITHREIRNDEIYRKIAEGEINENIVKGSEKL